jgi:branched-chain amino acid transport system permease protein
VDTAVAISVIWSGIVAGSIYALLGLSYYLLFRATQVLNFAVGGIAGLAGMAAATTNHGLILALLIGIAYAAAAMLVVDIGVTRVIQARETSHFGTVLALAAVLFVLIQISGVAFTQATVLGRVVIPGSVTIGDQYFAWQGVLVFVLAIATATVAWTWLRLGRRGRLLSAIGDDLQAARTLCFPVESVRVVTVVAAGLIAGVAGTMYAAQSPIDFQTGLHLSLVGFVAVVIGGLASVWGSLLGGLMLGVVQGLANWRLGGQWSDYVFLVIVLGVLWIRPDGLFAVRVRSWD